MNRKLLAALTVLLFAASPGRSAMSFDGSNDFVLLKNSLIFASGPYSFCAWFNINTLNNGATKLIWSQGSAADGTWIGLYVTTGNNLEAANGSVVVDYAISANRWYHACMTDTGGLLTLYVDGVSRGSSSGAAQYLGNADILGQSTSGNTATTFPGTIDDPRIYNRVLSDQEITSLFSSRCRLNITNGLLGYWRLDDGLDGKSAVGSIRDFSGNGNTATPNNGPTWTASTYINYP